MTPEEKRQKRNAYYAKWRASNREQRNKYLAEWRNKNREKIREQSLNWYYAEKDRAGDEFMQRKSEISKKVWEKNKEANKARSRGYTSRLRKENPDKILEYRCNWYGITKEQYEKMLEQQGGECAICKIIEKFVIDHDHETGEVRGLLCKGCNNTLGFVEAGLKRNGKLLEEIAEYLK